MGSTSYPRYIQRQWTRTWAHEAYVMLMAEGGTPDDVIAQEIGVQARYVTKLRLSFHQARNDTSGASLWRQDEDRTIMDMRDREGRQFVRIAAHLKRQPRDVQNRYNYLCSHQTRLDRTKKRGRLPCITCREDFISDDTVRIRRCEACKKLDAGVPDQFLATHGGRRGGSGVDAAW